MRGSKCRCGIAVDLIPHSALRTPHSELSSFRVELCLSVFRERDDLVGRLQESDVDVENTVHRQAGLEDVFLRLTGRSLIE